MQRAARDAVDDDAVSVVWITLDAPAHGVQKVDQVVDFGFGGGIVLCAH